MTKLSRANLQSQTNTLLADNSAGAISEADLRTTANDTSDSHLSKDDDYYTRIVSSVSGTGNAITISTDYPAAYTADVPIMFKAGSNNTGAITVNVNSLGALSLYNVAGTAISDSGTLVAGRYYTIVWNTNADGGGTDGFVLLFASGLVGSGVSGSTGAFDTITDLAGTGAPDFSKGLTAKSINDVAIEATFAPNQRGNDFTITGVSSVAITALNAKEIAYIDGTNDDLRVYSFDGTNWSQVGNDLNISSHSGDSSLAALSNTRVAHWNAGIDGITTYDWDGASWSKVGNTLTISSGAQGGDICALSSSRIAYIDTVNDDLRVYSFDGTNWSQVGNDLNISGVTDTTNNISITGLSNTRIAYIDGTNDDLRVYSFDGTNWSQVGNDLNISNGVAPVITALDHCTIAYIDGLNDDLRKYGFDGSDWFEIGTEVNFSVCANPAITALSSNSIAFYDTTGQDLRVYAWTPPNPALTIDYINTDDFKDTLPLTDETYDLGSTSLAWQDAFIKRISFNDGSDYLDVYDEGTFTPVVSDASSGGNTATYSTQLGVYTRIGRVVFITIRLISIDTTGLTAGNDVYIQGLPFNSAYNQQIHMTGYQIDVDANCYGLSLQAVAGNTYCRIKELIDNTVTDFIIVSELSSGNAQIEVGGFYFV